MNIFNNLLVSCPNEGGVYLIHGGAAFKLDNFNTTGVFEKEGRLFRGMQPSSIFMFGGRDIEIRKGAAFDDIHDILFFDGYLYVACTSENSIVKLDLAGNETRRWTLPGEKDSSHINCLAIWNERVVFSAFGDFKEHRGYKGKTNGSGFVKDLLTGDLLITGLSQPHSLVPLGDNLIVANSGERGLREYDRNGNLIRSLLMDGYTRGIYVSQEVIYVGLSCSRNIEEHGINDATVIALDKNTWAEIGRLCLGSKEIYAIQQINNSDYLISLLGSIASYSALIHTGLVAERDSAVAGRDAAVVERDAATSLVNLMLHSSSWRLTRPWRFLARLVRHGLTNQERQRLALALRNQYHRLPLPAAAKRLASLAYHKGVRRVVRLLRNSFRVSFTVPAIRPGGQQAGKPDFIVWGVIDWHFRHQRPQQLALALAASGRRVFYISPALVDDVRAGFEAEALDASGQLFQIKLFAKGAPSIYSDAPSLENVAQLRRSIGEVLDWADCKQIVSLVDHPFWYDMASVLPNSRLVYDCMDHHEGFGNNAESLMQLEKQLLSEAELTITTSTWLDDAITPHAKHRALIRNAGEYEHFAKVPDSIYRDPRGRRIIGYYGAIAEWFDLDLVESVARQHQDCTVLLIGADTANGKSRLAKLHNVTFTGEVPYSELPHYLHGFDVCLLPFKVVPLTLATNPVKAYEYLGAGKPIVTVDLPEMAQFGGLVYAAAGKDAFLAAVSGVLSQPEPDSLIQRRKAFAEGQTWQHRAEALIQQAESAARDAKVSVIVVTYNNIELTRACLESLDEYSQYEPVEIIVVDNASSDGTPAFLSEWVANGQNRRLILNDNNRGFAAANNQGLAVANGEYLVLLNNDTYVTPGWIRTLVRHLQRDKTIGLIGPVTNNIGNEAKIDIAYDGMDEMRLKSAAYTRRRIGQTYPLRTAAFFCVMMPRATYERVGTLDEAFGRGFFEDDDYCRRIEQLGLRVVCAEDAFIHHHLSASFNKLKQQDRQKLFEENKKIYEAKWGPWAPHEYR